MWHSKILRLLHLPAVDFTTQLPYSHSMLSRGVAEASPICRRKHNKLELLRDLLLESRAGPLLSEAQSLALVCSLLYLIFSAALLSFASQATSPKAFPIRQVAHESWNASDWCCPVGVPGCSRFFRESGSTTFCIKSQTRFGHRQHGRLDTTRQGWCQPSFSWDSK